MSKHITFIGYHAGQAWCWNKVEGDTGCHLPYLTLKPMVEFVEKHIDCLECKAVFYRDYVTSKERRGLTNIGAL